MLALELRDNRIHFGERFSVAFQRTLRIPNDGRTYPLPPGFGPYPVYPVEEFHDRLPPAWSGTGHFFLSMYQREAMWIAFSAAAWKPNAVKIGVGGIDAISGLPFDGVLCHNPQNYVVCPKQLWLDGLNSQEGRVSQFTAMPLGSGQTVEGQLTGAEEIGGIEVRVYEPKPGRFPDTAPPPDPRTRMYSATTPMGIAPGGTIEQKIYPDPYGLDVWDPDNWGRAFVHILNSQQFHAVTGQRPPMTPISAQAYTERGFPWFKLYDEDEGDLAPSENLRGLKSVE
jgi:hypothetical protein